MDETCVRHAKNDQPALFVTDTVDILFQQAPLKARPLLLRIFRLECLGLDEPLRSLPVVKLGSVNTERPASKLIVVVLPVQSCFHRVTIVIGTITTLSSISQIPELEGGNLRKFRSRRYLRPLGRTGLLWASWHFIKAGSERAIQKQSCSRKKLLDCGTASPTINRVPKRKISDTKLLSKAEVTQSALTLRQGRSKDYVYVVYIFDFLFLW